jgi:predicted transcriptional regulator
MNKMEKKFAAVKQILDAEINGEIDLPKKTVMFALTDEELTSLITKKRLELIRILGEKKPGTIQELANYVNRKLPAVDRDIKLLVKHDIVKTRRVKRGVQPMLNKSVLILPLAEPKTLMEMAT